MSQGCDFLLFDDDVFESRWFSCSFRIWFFSVYIIEAILNWTVVWLLRCSKCIWISVAFSLVFDLIFLGLHHWDDSQLNYCLIDVLFEVHLNASCILACLWFCFFRFFDFATLCFEWSSSTVWGWPLQPDSDSRFFCSIIGTRFTHDLFRIWRADFYRI